MAILPSRRAAGIAIGILMLMPWISAGAPGHGEDELKSATVLSFLRYSTWPGNRQADGPYTVGVTGRQAFVSTLRALLEGKSVNGHPLRLVELNPGFDPHCCHVLYFAVGKREEIQPALERVGSAPSLTIGETDRFLEYGGAVNLMLVDGHMAFEVSLEALGCSGVQISSKLLRLGQVRPRPAA